MLCIVSLVQLRQVRRSHRLVLDARPVDLFEPRMRLNLLSVCGTATQALVWIFVQQFHAQIASVVRQESVVDSWLAIFDVLVELFAVLAVEGREAHEHLVNDCAKGPPVCCFSMPLPLQHFRRKVLSCAAKRLCLPVPGNTHLRKTKVCQFDIALTID